MGLADIGRARPFSTVTGGLAEGARDLFKTTLAMDAQAKMDRSREIQDRLNTQALQEKEAQIARDNRPVFLDDFQARFPQPETAKYYTDILKQGGYVESLDIGGNKREFFRHKDFKEINDIIAKEPQRQEGFLAAQITDIGQQKTALSEQYRKAVEKGDSESAQKLKDQFDAIRDKEASLVESYRTLKKAGLGVEDLMALQGVKNAPAQARVEETIRHNIATEETKKEEVKIKQEKAVDAKGRPAGTAFQRNVNSLVDWGWSRKDAVEVMSGGKPMNRDTFVGNATLRIMGNEMIPAEEKQAAISDAINFFDTNVTKRGPQPKAPKPSANVGVRIRSGVAYLKKAKSREEAVQKIKALSEQGWSREDLAAAAKEAGWE